MVYLWPGTTYEKVQNFNEKLTRKLQSLIIVPLKY